MDESAQAWQLGFLAPAKIRQDLAYDVVEAIGGLALADARSPGNLFGYIRLSHPEHNVTAWRMEKARGDGGWGQVNH